MTVEVTMTTSTAQTNLDFLLKKRTANEAKVTAVSQSLVALRKELDDKEKALAEHSLNFRNAMEAISIRSSSSRDRVGDT